MTISDEELEAINKAINLRYGIDFSSYEPQSFKRRVGRVIGKLEMEGVLDLWNAILRKPDFVYTFINELTVGLTDLFRNPDLWIQLRDKELPRLKNESLVRIWHAGCSTGEEVYTMSIVLQDVGIKHKTEQLAVDINTKFLGQAKSGIYPDLNKSAFTKNFAQYNPRGSFEDYFQFVGQELHVKAHLKAGIAFEQMNLVRDEPKGLFDLIFVRNVMIYFDTKLKVRLLEQYAKLLKPDGLLVIGYFDALPPEYTQFFTLYDPVYKLFKPKK